MCQVKCEGCEEDGPLISCDCGSIVWDLCPECESQIEQEEDECSCYNDEINIYCRGCFG